MTHRKGGIRRRSRRKLAKHSREKGKVTITKLLAGFKAGEKVILKAESSVQKGMYHTRFHGKMGVVKGKRGRCYEVEIKDGSVRKLLLINPVHLKRG